MIAGGTSPERPLSLREAAQWIAAHTGAPPPSPSTLIRWVSHGVRGVRLQAKRVGAKFWTTPTEIAEFLDLLNGATQNQDTASVTSERESFRQDVRREQISAACVKIDNLCKGFA